MYKRIPGSERCTLLTKPEQSGKTFLMLQKIVEDFSEEPRDDGKININFILCDNNLLLVLQTSERVGDDEELNKFRNVETQEIYVEFSSSQRTKNKTSDSIFRLITTEKVRNIICCSNAIRCEDIHTIIKDINNSALADRFHFNIWFDEADKFIPLIRNFIQPIIQSFQNVSMYAITATPERIIKFYKEINIWCIENPTLENYHGWNDNKLKIYDNSISRDNLSFIEHILKTNAKEIKPNTRWFIPANIYKSTHIDTKNLLREYGFATMIINGDGIMIYLPNGEVIEENKDEMPDTLIPKIYKKYKLYETPFAITGYQCISRGISISSKHFMLTHSIMPHKISNKSELSQIAGRMKGNQKKWANYQKPLVFCSVHFNKVANDMEAKTIKLAQIAFEENWETVTMEKFKTVEKNYIFYHHPQTFYSYREALEYLSTQEENIKPLGKVKKEIDVNKMDKKKHIHKTPNGYILTSKMFKKEKIIKGTNNIEDDRVTYEKLMNMGLGNNISSPDSKTASYIIYPVYENMETPSEDVKYYVRHTKRRSVE